MNNKSAQMTLVELVDESGVAIGKCEKIAAHQPPGQLHRAFSVFLVDDAGKLLLQRRAKSKYHSPGVWTNTCCGHPFPGEAAMSGARRRLFDELGLQDFTINEAGAVRYRVVDTITGLVEYEYNHVFVGHFLGQPVANPDEVEEWVRVSPDELRKMQQHLPFSPWFSTVTKLFEAHIPGSFWRT